MVHQAMARTVPDPGRPGYHCPPRCSPGSRSWLRRRTFSL